MLKIKMIWRGFEFEYEALSFAHGITICEQRYNLMGLIGRAYIECADGNNTWITL